MTAKEFLSCWEVMDNILWLVAMVSSKWLLVDYYITPGGCHGVEKQTH